MVSYAVENYGGDADRVYATGSSSGAMMTNVLAGAYPNVIKAGSVYSGVLDGCFYVAGATAGSAPGRDFLEISGRHEFALRLAISDRVNREGNR